MKSVLVVDSSSEIRATLKDILILKGYNVVGAIKGTGSVEDGIEFIKGFDKVIIHPRCKNTIFEFGNYKYKVDARSGQVTRQIVDKNNHHIDAIRYALEPLMKKTTSSLLKKRIGR